AAARRDKAAGARGKPLCIPAIRVLNFAGRSFSKDSGHDDGLIWREKNSLHKLGRIIAASLAFKHRTSFLDAACRMIGQMNEWSSRNDRNLHCNHKTERALRPGQSVEQVHVFARRCMCETSVTQHNITR